MKYHNKINGAIIEPHSQIVAEQLAKSPDYEEFVENAPEVEKATPKAKKSKGK